MVFIPSSDFLLPHLYGHVKLFYDSLWKQLFIWQKTLMMYFFIIIFILKMTTHEKLVDEMSSTCMTVYAKSHGVRWTSSWVFNVHISYIVPLHFHIHIYASIKACEQGVLPRWHRMTPEHKTTTFQEESKQPKSKCIDFTVCFPQSKYSNLLNEHKWRSPTPFPQMVLLSLCKNSWKQHLLL